MNEETQKALVAYLEASTKMIQSLNSLMELARPYIEGEIEKSLNYQPTDVPVYPTPTPGYPSA